MEHRALGCLQVSMVGLGCNNFGTRLDAAATAAVVGTAIDAGIDYFDTAESYGDGRSEEYLGRALAGRRDDVLIATKWGHTRSLADGERGGDPRVIRRRLEASLARLGTDHVDHLQLHRPDPSTPHEETLGCLAELRAEGKVREIGWTAVTAAEVAEADRAAHAHRLPGYASVQNHYSLLTRDVERDGVLDVCRERGIAFVPFFPLESGLLTGKYRAGRDLPTGSRLAVWGVRATDFIDDERLATVERLVAWCDAHGRSLLELALGWLIGNPTVASVIAGATSSDQIAANVAASTWRPSDVERAEIDVLLNG